MEVIDKMFSDQKKDKLYFNFFGLKLVIVVGYERKSMLRQRSWHQWWQHVSSSQQHGQSNHIRYRTMQ